MNITLLKIVYNVLLNYKCILIIIHSGNDILILLVITNLKIRII